MKNRRLGYLIIYWEIFFYFADIFSALLLYKINFSDMFNAVDYFSDFSHIAKYWNSDQIKLFGR